MDTNACDVRSATAAKDVWTWDFVHDRTTNGGALKFLAILDEHTRECLALHPGRSIQSNDVLDILSKFIGSHGALRHIRSDNGPEFTAGNIRQWLADLGIETLYIAPVAPWQNGYIESFNSGCRDEFLEMNYFNNRKEAWILAEKWKGYNNNEHAQRALGERSPSEYTRPFGPSGSASLRSATPAGPKSEQPRNTP